MPDVQHKRGTLAALNALAAAGQLKPGQIYVLTDAARIAVALTASTFQQFAKVTETVQVDYVTSQAAFDAAVSSGDSHLIVRLPGS